MKLTIRDVAKMFKVPEKTVYGWVYEEELPAYQVNEQYHINRTELLEWASSRQIPVPADVFDKKKGKVSGLQLTEALEEGGIVYGLKGIDRDSVMRSVVQTLPLSQGVDREQLLRILQAREKLASTAVGGGIAIPHVRNPIIFPVLKSSVTLCFLEKPIDFGALDGQPVRVLLVLVSPTVRSHLQLLSRLSFVLRNPDFKRLLQPPASQEDIMGTLRTIEGSLASIVLPPVKENR
jgi:PTS system nitrogen regulatory IIA component